MTFEYLLGALKKSRNILLSIETNNILPFIAVKLKILLQVGVSEDSHHRGDSNTFLSKKRSNAFLTLQNKS